MKKSLTIGFAILLSTILGLLFSANETNNQEVVNILNLNSIIQQDVTDIDGDFNNINKVYDSGKLIGVISDVDLIDEKLKEIYISEYESTFPNTKLKIGENLYISQEMSLYDYENKDEEIANYIIEKKLYGVEVDAVELSNKDGVYDVIYVNNIDDFYEARDRYVMNYISADAFDMLKSNQTIPELTTYGSREIDVRILETMTFAKGVANPDKILMNKEEILHYLSYGDNPSELIYEVKVNDTIEGVGSKVGLSAQQVVSINSDVLKSVDQIINVGMELNVMDFNSPITVAVTKELIAREVVYPEQTIYEKDPNLREGQSYVYKEGSEGSKNTNYTQTIVDGKLADYKLNSEVVTIQPQQEIVNVGSLVIPGVGSGTFRWPVDNPNVTCAWGCYTGHRAVDIVNSYERYGNLYAADRGTVKENTYHPINGYYMVIDHNNGYESFYGHMKEPGAFPVGVNVNKGEIIGTIGSTGKAYGVHVHFFIIKNGSRVNPCSGYLAC